MEKVQPHSSHVAARVGAAVWCAPAPNVDLRQPLDDVQVPAAGECRTASDRQGLRTGLPSQS
jgi:hypothetical protein